MTSHGYPVTSSLNQGKQTKNPTFRRLWSYVPKQKLPLFVLTGSTAYTVFHNAMLPTLIRKMLCEIGKGNVYHNAETRKAILIVLGYFCFGALTSSFRTYLTQAIQDGTRKNIQQEIFDNILNKKKEFFDASTPGELSSILSKDAPNASEAVTTHFINCIRNSISIVNNFQPIFSILKHISLPLLAFPAFGLAFMGISRHLKKVTQQVSQLSAEVNSFVEQRISNIKTIRFFSREEHESSKYRQINSHLDKVTNKLSFLKAFRMGLSSLVINLGAVFLTGYASHLLQQKKISQDQLYTVFFHTGLLALGFPGLYGARTSMKEGLWAGERIFKLLDDFGSNNFEGESSDLRKLDNIQGHIEFHNVTFCYPQRPEETVISRVSFQVQAGKVIAIVGASGSGKSTIVSLLTKLYQPNEGSIFIDGVDIQQLDGKWLRRNIISVVDQEPVLFQGSVMENIRYGNLDATDEQVIDAAKEANAHEFIAQFPDGYQTNVGDRGALLSIGQKQRISIARAILKNPRILVLDEATSALDRESEAIVQEALEHVAQSRTVIVISHKPFLIERSDSVIVIKNGCIDQAGTYSELINHSDGTLATVLQKMAGEN